MSPMPMDEAQTRAYWSAQIQSHRDLLAKIQ
jgi:hypothetical protein